MVDPQDNPLIPPGQKPPMGNPLLPPGFVPPPPPPVSPSLGFQAYASDPQNAMKIQHAMIAPGSPLQPNAPPPSGGMFDNSQFSALNPPGQPPANSQPPSTGGPTQPPVTPTVAQPSASATAPQPAAPPMATNTPQPAQRSNLMPPQAAAPPNPMTPPGYQAPGSALMPPGYQAAQAKLGTDSAELQRLQKTGSGVSQVKNPWLKGLGMVGDFAAGALLGKGAAAIPGTTAHNQWLQQQSAGQVAQDNNAMKGAFAGQQSAADLAHTKAETASLGSNAAIKAQSGQVALAKAGLKTVLDENGQPTLVADEDSPAFQQQQLQQGLIKAHTDSYAATNELHEAQAAFNKAKTDPNSPLFRQTAQRLATAQQNAGAAQQRAQAYMGNYLMHSRNVDMSGNTLPGAPTIADDDGNQTVVGSTNAGLAAKNQSNAAQFNDVHGALDNLEGSARALVAKGGSLNSPGVAAALAQPSGTLGQWLQGAGVKANLTPEERQYVQSVAAAHENVQALRKSAGGTATDSAVQKLDSMIPGASTPDLNYLLGQTGQIRQTATRLGKGATTAAGGLTVRGQANGVKPNPMTPPTQAPKSYSQTATGQGGHKIGSNDGKTWFDVKTGKAVQ